MDIKQIKKDLGIDNKHIAKMFGYKNTSSYSNSSAKKRIEGGLVAIVKLIKKINDGEGN